MSKLSAVALLSMFFLAACSNSPSETAEQVDDKAGKDVSLTDEVAARIYFRQLAFENAEGRTGILAEKPQYSVFAEEVIIRDFFQDKEGGFYLDVGASFAIEGSNTYYLEKNLGWTGIGVDALEDYAAEWAKERPASKFFAYLVTAESGGEGVFYKSEGLGLSSTKKALASGKMWGKNAEVTEVRIPMITLNDLLDRENVKKIDLVSMDIEGHEPQALAGFDIERFSPELLVIEGKNKKVEQYMKDHGYVQIERYKQFDSVNRYFEKAK